MWRGDEGGREEWIYWNGRGADFERVRERSARCEGGNDDDREESDDDDGMDVPSRFSPFGECRALVMVCVEDATRTRIVQGGETVLC